MFADVDFHRGGKLGIAAVNGADNLAGQMMEGHAGEAEKWFRKAVGIEPRKARQNLQRLQGIPVANDRELQDKRGER